ncbi:unnamed protein product [Pleuronectes platessa]|uniref:Uncharacterized protein n=1 Tax=Pleuronectes platessa TaxID=8262 RepID=A0A9N7TLS7_PLEPL|nr:unnamed protein product [Pleuronectes platessa]
MTYNRRTARQVKDPALPSTGKVCRTTIPGRKLQVPETKKHGSLRIGRRRVTGMKKHSSLIIHRQRFAVELQAERSTNVALLDYLEKLSASYNEISQRYEADNLRTRQQATHLTAELEKAVKSRMQTFQAEQYALLQREVEELTSQLWRERISSIRCGKRRRSSRRCRMRSRSRRGSRRRRSLWTNLHIKLYSTTSRSPSLMLFLLLRRRSKRRRDI